VTQRQITDLLRQRHKIATGESDDFTVRNMTDAANAFEQLTTIMTLLLGSIAAISLIVGGIGIMNIMLVSVTERTREIGVRKALGARRQEVLFQFLAESVVLTSVGGVLGILLGSGIGVAIHLLSGFPISLPWWSFAIGLGFSATVGIFFGMVPAYRAARLDPIEALRYE